LTTVPLKAMAADTTSTHELATCRSRRVVVKSDAIGTTRSGMAGIRNLGPQQTPPPSTDAITRNMIAPSGVKMWPLVHSR
jgi:hypothetical protein